MRTKNVFFLIIVCSVLLLQTGCGQVLNASVGGNVNAMETVNVEENALYEITEADKDINGTNSTKVNLGELQDEYFNITQSGTYSLSGSTSNSKIIVNVDDDQVVHLLLDGVELYSEEGPAIYAENAAKVVITLVEGTENIVADGVNYMDEIKGCIFGNCDITINGKGKLYVYGFYHDGIRSKDCLKIINANISVKAKNNGVRGNDGVIIEDGTVDIQSEGIGIKTSSEKDFVAIKGGTCKIVAGENAVYSENYVLIKECVTDFRTVEEEIHCNGEIYINETEA